MIKQKAKLALLTSVLSLYACGGGDPNAYLPNMPYYNPTQNNTYLPKPDTHGYNPTTPPSGRSFSILKNVFLRVDPEVGVNVTHLEGWMEPKRPGDPVIFDDTRSFIFHIFQGQLIIDEANITRLKNKFTFNYPDAPLKEVQIQFTPGRIKMSGKMKQLAFWVPFEMEGTINPTPDGKLLMVPDKIIAMGIPSKGLMDLIGLTTSKLLELSAERGLKLEGNNIILDPGLLFPPPKIDGRVVGVQINQGNMTLYFDNLQRERVPRRLPPDPNIKNYMHCFGGNMLLSNELHRGAEMQMVDLDPSNPFDFYLGEYKRHLKAGYVKVMNDLGSLITLMPDYTKIDSTNIWDRYPGSPPVQQSQTPYPTYQTYAKSQGSLAGFIPGLEFWQRK